MGMETVMADSFQAQVHRWVMHCFGPHIAADKRERLHRFLEEALELVQSGGMESCEAHQLVDYVYNRPMGAMGQECGGVMVTLAALCTPFNLNMEQCGAMELLRVWDNVDRIRAKQAAKPKHSPLPA